MIRLDLKLVEHGCKVGAKPFDMEPNVTEDTMFYLDGKPIGFYLSKLPDKIKAYIDIANREFRSKNVPKSIMRRVQKLEDVKATKVSDMYVKQYSTIIGGTTPKPRFGKDYSTMSRIHRVPTARTFIKAMMLACKESELLIKKLLPEQYDIQKDLVKKFSPKKLRLTDLFTSSISNYNISAPYHQDNLNIKGCGNIIINKKRFASGGNLHVPQYGLVLASDEDTLIYYPAWSSLHGVTPIETTNDKGYRNSFIFYPLRFPPKELDV